LSKFEHDFAGLITLSNGQEIITFSVEDFKNPPVDTAEVRQIILDCFNGFID